MEETNKKPEDQVQDSTTVGQVDVNIDELFGMPGAENVMLPENKEDSNDDKPKSVFSKEQIDTTFLDKSEKTTVVNKTDDSSNQPEEKVDVQEALAELDSLITQEEDAGNKGRPKVDKSGLAELASKMIEEGSLVQIGRAHV
jgi:hypothetical protein